jgi:hypothetical protein
VFELPGVWGVEPPSCLLNPQARCPGIPRGGQFQPPPLLMMLNCLCVMTKTMNRQMSTPHLFFDNSNPGVNPISPNPNSPNLILFNPISLIPKRLIPVSPNSDTLQYENHLFVLTFKASDVSSDKSFAGHRGYEWQEHSLVRCRFTADTKEGELSSSRSGNTASYANFKI